MIPNRSDQQLEIERKYLVFHPPVLTNTTPYTDIEQAYLSMTPEHEVRVRHISSCWMRSEKWGRGLTRRQLEQEIGAAEYQAALTRALGVVIRKRRYFIPYQQVTIELDIFDGALAPLIIAEVEFDTAAMSNSFSPPDWFGPEVTNDLRYANRSLAINGLPSEFSVQRQHENAR